MKLNETAEAVSVLRKKKFKDSALGLYLEFSEMRRKQQRNGEETTTKGENMQKSVVS